MEDAPESVAAARYLAPPSDVVRILDAPPTPWVVPSPDGRWLVLVEHAAMPALADLARPMLRLAGLRIDPASDARHQVSFGSGLLLRAVSLGIDGERAPEHGEHAPEHGEHAPEHGEHAPEHGEHAPERGEHAPEHGEHAPEHGGKDSTERRIALPSGRRISSIGWSHTSERFACTLVGDEGSELWCADVSEARLTPLVRGLHAVFGAGFEWMPDGKRLVCSLVPRVRAPAPAAPALPVGPNVRETRGTTSPLRTNPDLLASPHAEALFAHHATSELAIVDGGGIARIGDAGIFLSFDVAPGGELLLVTRVVPPFSYVHGVYGFPQSIEVWNASGEREHVVAEIPTAENVPIEGVRTGPRGVAWNPHEDASLVWVEALDGGDPRRSVLHRDRWLEHAHPFRGEPRELLRLEHRASHLTWMQDPELVLAREYDRDRRWTRAAVHRRLDAQAPRVVLDDRSQRDQYNNPGSILTRTTERGRRIVRQEGSWIFRAGEGETAQGSRPFLDRQDLSSLRTERLWQSASDAYESFFAFIEAEEGADARSTTRAARIEPRATAFLSRHESPRDPPNLRLREPRDDAFRAVTRFPDPTPELRAIRKELVHYRREDGVALSGTLYLPADHRAGTRLPLVLWAYPRDFVDADTAGQVCDTPNTFTRIGGASHLFFLTQGYAVLDGASMPIIGDAESMNDTFIEQSVSAARAAIARVAELGVCDPERVGIGGHSYGAFMTANLLAHCDLFRAGIARSGAYNRTLTPFGFQAERRSLWEARESYLALSPFMQADKIKAPLLLVHGAEDNNPGTFPLQSERLFHAIKGNGGTARYVELPHESHAYRARESVLHVLHEMFAWFDRYVKNAER